MSALRLTIDLFPVDHCYCLKEKTRQNYAVMIILMTLRHMARCFCVSHNFFGVSCLKIVLVIGINETNTFNAIIIIFFYSAKSATGLLQKGRHVVSTWEKQYSVTKISFWLSNVYTNVCRQFYMGFMHCYFSLGEMFYIPWCSYVNKSGLVLHANTAFSWFCGKLMERYK